MTGKMVPIMCKTMYHDVFLLLDFLGDLFFLAQEKMTLTYFVFFLWRHEVRTTLKQKQNAH